MHSSVRTRVGSRTIPTLEVPSPLTSPGVHIPSTGSPHPRQLRTVRPSSRPAAAPAVEVVVEMMVAPCRGPTQGMVPVPTLRAELARAVPSFIPRRAHSDGAAPPGGGMVLPLSLLRTSQGHPMLVELKNGETYNGHLVSCDNWMNICLRDVICTSRDGDRFWKLPELVVRGNNIKYLRIPEEARDARPRLEPIAASVATAPAEGLLPHLSTPSPTLYTTSPILFNPHQPSPTLSHPHPPSPTL